MKKYLITAALIAMSSPSLAADGLTLTVGRLRVSPIGQITAVEQSVSVRNDKTTKIESAWVECGCFNRNVLVGTGTASVDEITPGQTGYDSIRANTSIKDTVDRAECRIVRWR